MTWHYNIPAWGRGSHRHIWFCHSLRLSLNHLHLCTKAVQLCLAQLPPGRASNRHRPSHNWEGCSALALVYTLHLWKHHCCTSLRDSCVGQSRGLPEAGATNLLQGCCDDTSQEITEGFSPKRRTAEYLFWAEVSFLPAATNAQLLIMTHLPDSSEISAGGELTHLSSG